MSYNAILALIPLIFSTLNSAAKLDMHAVLEELQWELRYETLVIFYNNIVDCPADLKLNVTSVPRLILSQESDLYLKDSINSKALVLVCQRHSLNEQLLQTLYQSLQHMRQTPTLFLLSNLKASELRKLFAACYKHKMLNVLALLNLEGSAVLYGYRAFPVLMLYERNAAALRHYFEDPMRNLQGHAISTLPDFMMPRSIVYKDELTGEPSVTGYVAELVKTFAAHLNATLDMNWNKELLLQTQIANFSVSGGVDLPMSITGNRQFLSIHMRSYPVELGKWSFMLPLEPQIKIRDFFFKVFEPQVMFLIAIVMACFVILLSALEMLHLGVAHTFDYIDQVLRSILGQTCVMPRHKSPTMWIIIVVLLCAGTLLSNSYMAYLGMLLIDAPTVPKLKTYEDIRNSKRKILFLESEVPLMLTHQEPHFWETYKDIFLLTESLMMLQELRNSLNTSYAYGVTTSVWPMLQNRQSRLKRPLFRISQDLIIIKLTYFVVPLEENSIYKEALNKYIMWVQATGLMEYWYLIAYHKMVQLGKLPFYPHDTDDEYHDMTWNDLLWIWFLFALCCGFNCLFCIAEVLYFHFLSSK